MNLYLDKLTTDNKLISKYQQSQLRNYVLITNGRADGRTGI